MITYATIIIASWAVFLLVWSAAAFGVKRDISGGGIAGLWYRYFLLRLVIGVLIVFVALRIASGTAHVANLQQIFAGDLKEIFVPPVFMDWIGATLTAFGVLFAVWARVHLGRNWSPAPAVKEEHELVMSGPYRFVRHPIYTGMVFAALGTALTGTIFGVGVFVAASIIFYLRIDKEERIMLGLFPNQYPAYQERTKKLIPWIW